MGSLILVLDDSKTVSKIVEVCLRREGYEVLCFSDGETVIEWAVSAEPASWSSSPRARIPDLIFVDLCLPRMDGYSVIRHLRAQPAFRQIPFVILSRRNGFIHKLKGKLAGADGYVEKPFTVDRLISIVQSYLGSAEVGLVPA